MYHTYFLTKDSQKIREYKHYANILSHLKSKSEKTTIPANCQSIKTASSKLGSLLAPLLKGKPKVKPSLQELSIIIGLF